MNVYTTFRILALGYLSLFHFNQVLAAEVKCVDVLNPINSSDLGHRSNLDIIKDAYGDAGEENFEDAVAYTGLSLYDIASFVKTGNTDSTPYMDLDGAPQLIAFYTEEHPRVRSLKLSGSSAVNSQNSLLDIRDIDIISRREAGKKASTGAKTRTLYYFWMAEIQKKYPNSLTYLNEISLIVGGVANAITSTRNILLYDAFVMANERSFVHDLDADPVLPKITKMFESLPELEDNNSRTHYAQRIQRLYAMLEGSSLNQIIDAGSDKPHPYYLNQFLKEVFVTYQGPTGVVAGLRENTVGLFINVETDTPYMDSDLSSVHINSLVDLDPIDDDSYNALEGLF